jgi:hypothetical protein
MRHTVDVQQTLKRILQLVAQRFDNKQKATENALSTFWNYDKTTCSASIPRNFETDHL